MRFKYIICFVLLSVSLASCGGYNRQQTDSIFEQATLQLKAQGGQSGVRRVIDSASEHAGANNTYFLLRKYRFLKQYYYAREDADSNELYIDSILYTLEKFDLKDDHPAEYADMLNNKGNYFFSHNDLARAFNFYYRAKLAAGQLNDTCLYGDQSYHLGMVTYRQQEYSQAIRHFQAALNESPACPDAKMVFFRRQELMNNIALAFFKQGMLDSAERYYLRALRYITQDGPRIVNDSESARFNEMAVGVLYGNLADVLVHKGAYDTAAGLLRQSIAINSRPRLDNTDALLARVKLVKVYLKLNDLAQAKMTMDEVGQQLAKSPENDVRRRWLYSVYEYNNAAGNTTSALSALQQYQALKDTAEAAVATLRQTDFSQQLRDRETQYQLDLLIRDNKLHKVYLWITVALIGIAVAIAVLVAISYRRSQRHVRLLETLNIRINAQKLQQDETMAQLVKSNHDMDRILHMVAHDLRSPVNATIMMCDLLAPNIADASDRELMDMVLEASRGQQVLIGELLEFGRDGNSQENGNRQRADIGDLCRKAAAIQQFNATGKRQQIHVDLPAEPMYALVSADKIQRVVNNLLTNAMKFSREDSNMFLRVTARNGKVVVEVEDGGIGIPDKYKNQVFEPFTAAKRYGTMGEKPFGLGLSICRRIVETHGGRIWFESKEGVGSTFFIELPIVT